MAGDWRRRSGVDVLVAPVMLLAPGGEHGARRDKARLMAWRRAGSRPGAARRGGRRGRWRR